MERGCLKSQKTNNARISALHHVLCTCLKGMTTCGAVKASFDTGLNAGKEQ